MMFDLKNRLISAAAALLGWPVAYNLTVVDGTMVFDGDKGKYSCRSNHFDGAPKGRHNTCILIKNARWVKDTTIHQISHGSL